ncbi:tegument protein [Phascolarctid gammaherpesvirus 1]|uniref:Tegument protein n=1 Tax=Phascolarctid gammaherpesvirus 1 TaxID=2249313 RepID=A0A3Q8J778_9GAMA|nr:tegument protein [Phascolarctid gammaherpesvirus 1]AZB49247.1 tegument protein [Phascolarctid gammaherpesvirus 1]
MPLFLLSEIKRTPSSSLTRLIFVPDGPTLLESLFLRHSNEDRSLHLIRDSFEAEKVLIFFFDPTTPENAQLRAIRTFLSSLAISGGSPHSALLTGEQGDNSVLLRYGPTIQERPTCQSLELFTLLEPGGHIPGLIRVEVGRQFSIRSSLETTGELEEEVFNELVSTRDLTLYETFQFSGQGVAHDPLVNRHGPPFEGHTDKVNETLFASDVGIVNLARQVGIATGTSSVQNGKLFTLLTADRANIKSLKSTGPARIITHATSNLSFLDIVLEALRYHASVTPLADVTGSCMGIFTPPPPLSDVPLKGSHDLGILMEQMQDASNLHLTGTPSLCGFHRTWLDTSQTNTPWTKSLRYCSLLSVTPERETQTIRPGSNQYILCIGDFVGDIATAQSVDLYCESPAIWVKIRQTLSRVQEFALPLVSGSTRHPHRSSTGQHLTILLKTVKLGGKIFLSGLPKWIKREFQVNEAKAQLRKRAEEYLTQYFFTVHSPCLFLLVEDRQLDATEPHTSTLPALLAACQVQQCAISVLGVTTPRIGQVEIIDDLDAPVPTHMMPLHTGQSSTVFKLPGSRKRPLSTDPGTSDNDDVIFVSHDGQVPRLQPWPHVYAHLDLLTAVQQTLAHPSVGSKEYITYHIDRCGSLGTVAQQCGVGESDLPLSDYSIVLNSGLVTPRRKYGRKPKPQDANIWNTLTFENIFDASLRPAELVWSGYVTGLGEQAAKVAMDPAIGAQYCIIEALTNCMLAGDLNLDDFTLSLSLIWPEDEISEISLMLYSCKELTRDLGISMEVAGGTASSFTINRHNAPPDTSSCNSGVKTVVCMAKCCTQKFGKISPCLSTVRTHLIVLFGDSNPRPLLSGSILDGSAVRGSAIRPPDVDAVKNLFWTTQQLMRKKYVLSGHDISDGGLITCLIEMALGGNLSMQVSIPGSSNPLEYLLSETPGIVIEVLEINTREVLKICKENNVRATLIGRVNPAMTDPFTIRQGDRQLFCQTLTSLRAMWSQYSDRMRALLEPAALRDSMLIRDYGNLDIYLGNDTSLAQKLRDHSLAIYTMPDPKCIVAFLRVPGFVMRESLITAFMNAGCSTMIIDLYGDDIREALAEVRGLVVGCYPAYKQEIEAANAHVAQALSRQDTRMALMNFLNRPGTFSLSVGTFGFLLLQRLGLVGVTHVRESGPTDPERDIVLEETSSNMFESRWLNIRIPDDTRSIAMMPLRTMIIPCWVQGRYLGFSPSRQGMEHYLSQQSLVACTYHGHSTDSEDYAKHYPRNPSHGLPACGLSSPDGRHTALLFDPSLAFHPWQWQHLSPTEDITTSPWSLLFHGLHLWAINH